MSGSLSYIFSRIIKMSYTACCLSLSHLYGRSPVRVTNLQVSNLYQRLPSFPVFCILWFKAPMLHVISYCVHPSSFGLSSLSLPHYLQLSHISNILFTISPLHMTIPLKSSLPHMPRHRFNLSFAPYVFIPNMILPVYSMYVSEHSHFGCLYPLFLPLGDGPCFIAIYISVGFMIVL